MRGFADGIVSIILPVYLVEIGLTPTGVGAIIFATLAGSAILALWIGFQTNRLGRRRVLIGAAILMLATGVGFLSVRGFWALFAVAFAGTLNPSAGDVSLFLPVEQAALAQTVSPRDMTAMFSRYNVAGSMAGALGALASAAPIAIAAHLGFARIDGLLAAFAIYCAVAVAAAIAYMGLSADVETSAPPRASSLVQSRGIVIRLAALFSLDSAGGGFVIQSLLVLWLVRRYHVSVAVAGTFFFFAGTLSAISQLISSPIASRFGRINTMVFTHIPANLFLAGAALMPNLPLTLAMLLARSALSSMDVPARQSYVMAVVPPEERAAAAGVTNVPRSLAAAITPLPAGAMFQYSMFGWPLIAGGAMKIAYDLLLLWQFRAAKPPDELD
jgi:MFS family permease